MCLKTPVEDGAAAGLTFNSERHARIESAQPAWLYLFGRDRTFSRYENVDYALRPLRCRVETQESH
jgi:hypothetical protein